MELVKNIFFNTDKLIENSNVKISYTGNLFQDGSDQVFIHFGFGDNWDNVSDIEMTKTDLGFQANLQLLSSNSLNLCFRNQDNNWDNNNGQNYTFNIEEAPVSLAVVENNTLDVPRRLRKTYLWSKKIKLAVYKIIRYFPRIISGNYKKKAQSLSNE
mgnify:FL=1